MRMRLIVTCLVISTLPTLTCAQGIQSNTKSELPTLELSADASRVAPNDLARVRVYVEQTDANPAELAKRVNQRIAEALAVTKAYPSVKTNSAGTQTYPLYGKGGVRIENWRMRSELALESKNIPALSELIGKLQTLVAVEQLILLPAPETQQHAADEAMVDAIKAFQARAALGAQALGKKYRVKYVNVGSNANPPRPMYAAAKAAMMDSAAPAPIEAGESTVSVNVNGVVELLD